MMKSILIILKIAFIVLVSVTHNYAQTTNKTIPLTLVELVKLNAELNKNPTQELLNKYNEEVNRTLQSVINQKEQYKDLHLIWTEKISKEYTANGSWTNPITGKVEQGSPAAYPILSWKVDEILLEVLPYISEFNTLQELKDRLQSNSQKKIPYTLFEITYVNKNLAEWQKKSEFEKTSDWEVRVTEVTQKQKIDELKADALEVYAKWKLNDVLGVFNRNVNHSGISSDEYFFRECKGSYNADKEVYTINVPILGDIAINVPIGDAKSFSEAAQKDNRSAYGLRLYNLRYIIQNDELALAEATFMIPSFIGEGTMYKYINPAASERKKSSKEIELEKEQAKAYLLEAESSSYNGRYQDAKSSYQKVIDSYPEIMDIHQYSTMLRVYFKTEDYSQIITTYQKMLKLAPNGIEDVGAYYYLGFAYYQLKDYVNVIDAYQHVIESNYSIERGFNGPINPNCYNDIIEEIQNIINSTNGLVDKSKAYSLLGDAYYKKEGFTTSWYKPPSVYDISIEAYQKAISLTSDSKNQAKIYRKLGKVFEAQRESSKAIKAYKKAAQLED